MYSIWRHVPIRARCTPSTERASYFQARPPRTTALRLASVFRSGAPIRHSKRLEHREAQAASLRQGRHCVFQISCVQYRPQMATDAMREVSQKHTRDAEPTSWSPVAGRTRFNFRFVGVAIETHSPLDAHQPGCWVIRSSPRGRHTRTWRSHASSESAQRWAR